MSTQQMTTASLPFTGFGGRVLERLLQLDFVRYHRLQLGFVECPLQYERFIADVMGPRIEAMPGTLGVFGVGVHTDVLLKALPKLRERIHCFTDNNASLWRQTRHARPVLPPAEAVAQCDAFLLSTAVFQRVLEGDLRRLGFTGPVMAMDDVVPAAWFLGNRVSQ